ncbi:MAG: M20/M25/M40 family metallo-hydrolase [Deltaproteobacteria bacterium]|nr:M20/M25/M40 family metallo-hydrolase [Deltaproteobacteria bacterium]
MTPSDAQRSVLDKIDEQAIAKLLVDLVNIGSPTGEEGNIARFLVERFENMGLKAFLQEADQDRYNAVGIIEGDGTGFSLMFNGHLDTTFTGREKVGLRGGWGLLPTASSGAEAVTEGGRIYGLGATNMKGGIAAFVSAAEAIKKAGIKLRGDLITAGVIGEIIMAPVDDYSEPKLRGYTRGTHYLVTHGVTADMAVVAEPTGGVIRLGHFGPQWVKISTYGVTANTVYAGEVVSSIDRMLRIIAAVKQWIPGYQEKIYNRSPHMKTKPAVRISAIHGGAPWRLARPAGTCSIYLDIRTNQPPPELKREIVKLLRKVKEEVGAEDPDFDFDVDFYLTQPGAEIDPEHPLVSGTQEAHQLVHNATPEKTYSAIDSDASVLTHFGIPAINYGPRPMDASTRTGGREYQNIEDVVNVAKVFALLALDVCSREA